MKRLILLFIGTAMTSLAMTQTASPELVSSSGDSFINESYHLDWSVGESLTATHTEGMYVLTQGLHQNNYVITAVEYLQSDINISVNPNPTTDFISLQIESSKEGSMQYKIYDISGRVLQVGKIVGHIEKINFSTYANRTYFIAILANNQLIKTFKIIKN